MGCCSPLFLDCPAVCQSRPGQGTPPVTSSRGMSRAGTFFGTWNFNGLAGRVYHALRMSPGQPLRDPFPRRRGPSPAPGRARAGRRVGDACGRRFVPKAPCTGCAAWSFSKRGGALSGTQGRPRVAPDLGGAFGTPVGSGLSRKIRVSDACRGTSPNAPSGGGRARPGAGRPGSVRLGYCFNNSVKRFFVSPINLCLISLSKVESRKAIIRKQITYEASKSFMK